VVEAIVVLTLLFLYQLKLYLDVERARLGSIMALIGLPGPILRIMHGKPVMVSAAGRRCTGTGEGKGEGCRVLIAVRGGSAQGVGQAHWPSSACPAPSCASCTASPSW